MILGVFLEGHLTQERGLGKPFNVVAVMHGSIKQTTQNYDDYGHEKPNEQSPHDRFLGFR